eukprot:14455765-Alexandrium_andersonii.AAC.1
MRVPQWVVRVFGRPRCGRPRIPGKSASCRGGGHRASGPFLCGELRGTGGAREVLNLDRPDLGFAAKE